MSFPENRSISPSLSRSLPLSHNNPIATANRDNAEALQQLVDMGFPENRARKALQIHRGHAQLGMDWLLEHEGDADIDEPLSQDHLRHLRQVGCVCVCVCVRGRERERECVCV